MACPADTAVIRAHFEAWLIRVAIWILRNRNGVRSRVVSRHDNNEMWAVTERLEGIPERIANGYRDA